MRNIVQPRKWWLEKNWKAWDDPKRPTENEAFTNMKTQVELYKKTKGRIKYNQLENIIMLHESELLLKGFDTESIPFIIAKQLAIPVSLVQRTQLSCYWIMKFREYCDIPPEITKTN